MLDQAMDAIGQELIDCYAKWNPIWATYIGIHDYDHLLPDSSLDALRKELKLFKDYRARIEAIKPEELSLDRRIDRSFLLHSIDLALFDEEVLCRSQRFPQAPSEFGSAIMLPFMREFAPLPERLGGIASRLDRAPRFFDDAKERLKKPVKLWVEIAAESCERMQGLLKMIEETAKGATPQTDVESLAESSAKASATLSRHEKWLRETILPKSKPVIGIGARNFNRLIKLRGLGMSTDELYSIGKKYLSSAKKHVKILADQLKPSASVEEVKEMIQANRPKDFTEALAATTRAMNEAKEFVSSKGIATLPPSEQLKVIETPEYLRHVMPFAAYMPTAKFDKVQQGIYMVTPVEKDTEELKKHSFVSIWNTAVHEAYPGHHLHSTCSNTNRSVARAFTWASETVEGWAHYCEDMMKEHRFHAEPEAMFLQTLDIIWRACRIIIDVDLHRRKMTFEQAVTMLVKEAGMDERGAVAEIKRYTYNPGYQLSYLIGKHMILELREKTKKRMGAKYTDRFFHDTFLYSGMLPMKLIEEVFEQKVREKMTA